MHVPAWYMYLGLQRKFGAGTTRSDRDSNKCFEHKRLVFQLVDIKDGDRSTRHLQSHSNHKHPVFVSVPLAAL